MFRSSSIHLLIGVEFQETIDVCNVRRAGQVLMIARVLLGGLGTPDDRILVSMQPEALAVFRTIDILGTSEMVFAILEATPAMPWLDRIRLQTSSR